MTAPIVWSWDREPLSDWQIGAIGSSVADADRHEFRAWTAGQLWERLAEYAENHS